MQIRKYSELIQWTSFEDRFDYLSLGGSVGCSTFGFDRYLNQRFYTSKEWKDIRNHVIARDRGLDLGVEEHEIFDKILIHHMNPIQPSDIVEGSMDILDPEFLITTSHKTHNAIHYGNRDLLASAPIERRPGDTKLW